jgi:hypothetical protein
MTILGADMDSYILAGQRFVEIVEKIPDKFGYTKTNNTNMFKKVNIDEILSPIFDIIDDLQRFEIKGSHILK